MILSRNSNKTCYIIFIKYTVKHVTIVRDFVEQISLTKQKRETEFNRCIAFSERNQNKRVKENAIGEKRKRSNAEDHTTDTVTRILNYSIGN